MQAPSADLQVSLKYWLAQCVAYRSRNSELLGLILGSDIETIQATFNGNHCTYELYAGAGQFGSLERPKQVEILSRCGFDPELLKSCFLSRKGQDVGHRKAHTRCGKRCHHMNPFQQVVYQMLRHRVTHGLLMNGAVMFLITLHRKQREFGQRAGPISDIKLKQTKEFT